MKQWSPRDIPSGWVRNAILGFLGHLDKHSLDRFPRIIVYPGGSSPDTDEQTIDLFMVTNERHDDGERRLEAAAARTRETTGVHIALHRVSPEYLQEIEEAATAFHRDLEHKGFQLKPGRTD